MNTYTKMVGGWALVAPGFSPASLALSRTKVGRRLLRLRDGLRQLGAEPFGFKGAVFS
jgi:hypothetical protein